ncbi:MAG: hypothetical protein WC756_22180 [Taibaiella sp.]|jgi:hypothetical protein
MTNNIITEVKEIMINAYIIGVMHERQSSPLGVMVDGNYTDNPREMAEEWINNLINELEKQK